MPDPTPTPLAPKKHLRPKDAATILLLRKRAGEAEILLGCRSDKHVFMPNQYVFPGGRIDRIDYGMPTAGDLHPLVLAKLTRSLDHKRAQALALSGIRETYEETGLIIGKAGQTQRPRPAWADFCQGGILPDLSQLDYLCRAITPPIRPRRFNARFFVCDGEQVLGTLADRDELLDLQWVTLDAAFKLQIPPITAVVLKELVGYLKAGPTAPFSDRPVPVYHQRNGKWQQDWDRVDG